MSCTETVFFLVFRYFIQLLLKPKRNSKQLPKNIFPSFVRPPIQPNKSESYSSIQLGFSLQRQLDVVAVSSQHNRDLYINFLLLLETSFRLEKTQKSRTKGLLLRIIAAHRITRPTLIFQVVQNAINFPALLERKFHFSTAFSLVCRVKEKS